MEEKKTGRLASLDALRGFDMFWIMGGAGIVTCLCKSLGFGGDCWLAQQMKHVDWIGLAHHDTIFPLFLFLAGVSFPFSLASQQAKGRTSLQIHLKVLFRMCVLFLFGLSFGGFFQGNDHFRLMSVLGYIGISWGLAAFAFMHLKRQWQRGVLIALLLGGYWIVTRFFGVAPDAPAGTEPYSVLWNIPMYFDRMLWPNHMLIPNHEPESLFAVPTGVALALSGMCAGFVLRCECYSPKKRAGLLAIAAGACLGFTLVSIYVLGDPMIKKIWTTSFVLAAATYSFAMLALFYWIIDVKGWNRWTVIFDPVGKNSILVYTLSMVGITWRIQKFFLPDGSWGGALGTFLVTWCIARFCQKKGIFLKV